MSLLREELYVVATTEVADEVAGYLIYEVTRNLSVQSPPKLRIEDCWTDPDNLIETWLQAHPNPEDGSPAETLGEGVGLRRITVWIELEPSENAEKVADEQLPHLVNQVIKLADSQGADLNYKNDSPYCGLVRIVDSETQ